jgi:bifunctional non-homologous end joining protein LigD
VPPKIIPIRPVDEKDPFDNPDWLFELKHDGFRALAYVERGRCRLVSRNNYHFPHWPKLCEWIASNLHAKNAVLDGELACLADNGRSIFDDLLFRRRPPIFYVFDVLWWNGADLRDMPLVQRKEFLRTRLPTEPTQILYADYVEGTGVELFRKVCEMDLEGIVAKRMNSLYRDSTRWLKIRNPNYTQKEGRKELFESRR